jgi:hypothetical protein
MELILAIWTNIEGLLGLNEQHGRPHTPLCKLPVAEYYAVTVLVQLLQQ